MPGTVTVGTGGSRLIAVVSRPRASLYRKRSRRRVWLVIAVVLGFVFSGFAGAFVYFLPAIRVAFADTGHGIQRSASTPTAGGAVSTVRTPQETVVPDAAPGQPFTVLLLGSDNDSKFSSDSVLTQSMILARVNPATKRVVMLSIPRDLYVPLSSGHTDKIDKAYSYGGAGAAVRTVEQDFGIHVDHYAWIGLLGLVKLINSVGGVDVVASNPVLDDFYPADILSPNPYAFQRVAVLPGPQHMDGIEALQYVRSRHGDLRSDFGRSQRQQQVLLALRAKAKLLGLSDLPDIADAMANEFSTDMSIPQVAALLPIASNVTLSNVQQVILSPPYSSSATIGDQDVLLPNWDLILPEVHRFFPRV
jgi:LCP family protein required for cell wall assembly